MDAAYYAEVAIGMIIAGIAFIAALGAIEELVNKFRKKPVDWDSRER